MSRMNRVKFLVFALVTAGLWAYHVVVSGAGVVKVAEPATGGVVGAGAAVALRIEAQRSELQAALVQLSASPAAWNLAPRTGAGKDGPGVDRFNAVRQVLANVLSEANKPVLVVALSTDQGSLVGLGAGEPSAPPPGFDVVAAAQGGAAGSIVNFGEVPYLFFATPLLMVDRNEVRVAGQTVAGLPLLPDAKRLEAMARELRLSTLAIVSQNKVLLAAGTEKVQAEPSLKALKAGQVGALGSGAVRHLGPLGLPLFTDSAHAVGSRQVLSGTPFEVLAVASLREPLEALASYQVFGILALLGLVLLAAVVGVLIKSEDDGGTRMSLPPPLPLPPAKKEEPQPVPLMGSAGHGPEGSPDDFHFPPSAVSAVRAKDVLASFPTPSAPQPQPAPPGPPVLGTAPEPHASSPPPLMGFASPPVAESPGPIWASQESSLDYDPFASAGPVPFPPSRPSMPPPLSSYGLPPTASSPAPGLFDEGLDQREAVYPTFAPGGDPFASAGPMDSGPAAEDDSPDATRVAVVPQELIKASRPGSSGLTSDRPPPRMSSEGMPRVQSVAPAADPEERHYQDTFREFVATREKCGEPADGLTFERFKAKLLKNRDQLVSKYQCRTVRFQVYVKEGKAALKATPVKE